MATSAQQAKRILFLIDEMTSITAGGTERQLLQIVGFAQRAGFETEIAVLRGTEWLTPEMAGCPVTRLNVGSVASRSGVASLRSAAAWMRSRRFVLVVSFFPESNLLAPWLAKFAGVPHVLGTRRNLNHARSDAPRNALRLQWLSNFLADEILANSFAVKESIAATERFSRPRIRVVYNGLDLAALRPSADDRQSVRRSLGVGPDDLLVGNVSGLREIKGVDVFVEAAAIAHRQDSRLRFVLIGEGEMRPKLEAGITAHKLEGVFHLAGAAEHVLPWLAAFDIAVLSSHAEGFSNSLLEYMAAGLPSIATDVGGNSEALDGAGVLVPPASPQALADAILSLRDPLLRAHMSSAAVSSAARFDVQEAEQRMVEIFRRYT